MGQLTAAEFLADRQGSRFPDVVEDPRLDFQVLLEFFSDPARQTRMEDAEKHHDRPALAGVVRELENSEPFRTFFRSHDANTTRRMRQAIGVIVRMVMEKRGWRKTGRKGSLGQKMPLHARTTSPGAHHNTSGLSWWFTRVERYEKLGEAAYPLVGQELPTAILPSRRKTRTPRKEA